MSDQISELMHTAILCAEDNHWAKHSANTSTADTNPQDQALIRLPAPSNFDKTCALYPSTGVEDDYFNAAERDVPTLLLSGHFDPITPPRWAEVAKKTLSQSQHIVVPGGHHIVSRLECVTDIIENFIAAPDSIGSLDDTCVKNIRPADFFIDTAGPAMEAHND